MSTLPFGRRDARKSDFFPNPRNPTGYFSVAALLHKVCGGELHYDPYAGGGMHKCDVCWSKANGGGFWRMTTVQRFTDQDIADRFWAIDK